jgi:Tfp pilus assembly protein PilF
MFRPRVFTGLWLAILAIQISATAQTVYGFRGDVTGVDGSTLLVEVFDLSSRRSVDRQPVRLNGSFEVQAPAGTYEIRVMTNSGDVLARAYANVGPSMYPISIRLPESAVSRPPNGTVSVRQLSREQNKRLKKEFAAAAQAARRGDSPASIRHLERVLAIDPNFAGAHVNLGVRYFALKEIEKARAEFRRAAELDPALVMAHANLALAAATLGHLAEAEEAATRALRMDPSNSAAREVIKFTRKHPSRMVDGAAQQGAPDTAP